MRKLRIAYVTPRYFPHVGGVEYVVRNLAEQLTLKGHAVTVITGEPYGRKTTVEKVNEVEVVRVPTYTVGEAYHVPREKMAVRRLLQESFDVVHTHSIHAVFSLLPSEVKRLGKSDWKLVISMHHSTEGYTFFRWLAWKLIWKRYVTHCLGCVDLVHVTSPIEADIVSEHFPCVKGRIVTIPLGIEKDVLNYRWNGKNSDYLLYCGRLEKYKRIDLAVDATSHLAKLGYKIRLVIVGSGSMVRKIEKVSKQLAGYVSYFPPKPRSEYLDLLSNARFAISLSSAENFNLFLAEAYVMGVPLIATREAVAFCPELANVKTPASAYVEEAILRGLSSDAQGDLVVHALKTWDDVIKEFELSYNSIL
jgi:glycosyltransferase involved in cell wall biosynthesis